MKGLKAKLSLKVKIPINTIEPSSPTSTHSNDCTHIVDNIYISGYKTSIDYQYLKANNFTHIINCAGGTKSFIPEYFEDFSYLTLELRDDSTSNIEQVIEQFLTFMKTHGGNKRNKILVHCYEGISRAPALLCAYLMKRNGICFRVALERIKEKRSCVEINVGFMFQLENIESRNIPTIMVN